MKRFVLLFAVALGACTSPEESGLKVIVGAKLIPADGRPPIDYSVVVIKNDKFRDVGPQSSTPVPKGAEITRGNGMTIEPSGGPIEPGKPANLVLWGNERREMHDGQWVQ